MDSTDASAALEHSEGQEHIIALRMGDIFKRFEAQHPGRQAHPGRTALGFLSPKEDKGGPPRGLWVMVHSPLRVDREALLFLAMALGAALFLNEEGRVALREQEPRADFGRLLREAEGLSPRELRWFYTYSVAHSAQAQPQAL